jgi:tetratricopeptide (TPR) repeat protein
MRTRSRRPLAFGIIATCVLLVQASAAHSAPPATGSPSPGDSRRDLTKNPPKTAKERRLALDGLYEQLAAASDQRAAQPIAEAIEQLWLHSGSDTVNLMMERSLEALKGKKPELALKLLDGVVGLRPNFAEALSRRAFVHFSQKDYARALADLRLVLAREPRHFKAHNGLATILRELGHKAAALKVYRRLLEIHPFWEDAAKNVDELSRETEGQDT